MGKKSNDHFPEDLVMDIQLRLPVKSLLRFRCVSKPWCARFQNHNFITAHHLKQNALNGHNYANSNMIVQQFHGDGRLCENNFRVYPMYFTSLNTDFNMDEEIIITAKENIYMPFTNNWLDGPTVIGPVNGIFCLVDCDSLGLWNPATREFKLLPESTVKRPLLKETNDSPSTDSVGFGFDSKTNDYKVVRFITNFSSEDVDKFRQTEIYNLSNNSWREVPYPWGDYHVDFDLSSDLSPYANGMYHWKSGIIHGYSYNVRVILSFDMAEEVFTTTSFPDDIYVGVSWLDHDWYLASFEGCPAAIIHTVEAIEKCYDVWVLKELGVKESWVKQLTIGPILGIEKLLGFWKNGRVFMENNDHQLVLYDPSTQELKNLQIPLYEYLTKLIIYVESLVSINGRQEVTHVALS